MSLYSLVQRKAQEEIDRVIGSDRLPDFSDYDNLVYVQDVIMETLRWMPIAPIGVPHSLARDDEYRCILIPKGAIIIAVSLLSTTYVTHVMF